MRRRARWLLVGALGFALLSLLSLWLWGRFAVSARGAASLALPVAPAQTRLDRALQPLLDGRDPRSSAAALLTDPIDAFVARARSARAAERSLDLQYYIWNEDETGRLLQRELLLAARRGVRVRLLLDDMRVSRGDKALRALDAHPNVEVRLFNPARNRANALLRAVEMALRFVGFNRRMHNKAWIADGRLAIVGGRNIGDEYFGAADTNFHDADLLLIGPAVDDAGGIFDAFWNAAEVVPLAALHALGEPWSEAAFTQRHEAWLRAAEGGAYLTALAAHANWLERLTGGEQPLVWAREIHVISDPPEKASAAPAGRDRANWLLYDVMQLLFSARTESLIMSPYFVPGDSGTLLLAGQAGRGMHVAVLTNSLAATDVPMVHAGYARYRRQLLQQRVRLHEMRATGDDRPRRHIAGTSSGASLHSKAIIVDGRRGFVGSFNFDPRSAQLNTEMGVMFDAPELAAQVRAHFLDSIRPEVAWRVELDSAGALRWYGTPGEIATREPEAGRGLRALAWLLGWLPVESQL